MEKDQQKEREERGGTIIILLVLASSSLGFACSSIFKNINVGYGMGIFLGALTIGIFSFLSEFKAVPIDKETNKSAAPKEKKWLYIMASDNVDKRLINLEWGIEIFIQAPKSELGVYKLVKKELGQDDNSAIKIVDFFETKHLATAALETMAKEFEAIPIQTSRPAYGNDTIL